MSNDQSSRGCGIPPPIGHAAPSAFDTFRSFLSAADAARFGVFSGTPEAIVNSRLAGFLDMAVRAFDAACAYVVTLQAETSPPGAPPDLADFVCRGQPPSHWQEVPLPDHGAVIQDVAESGRAVVRDMNPSLMLTRLMISPDPRVVVTVGNEDRVTFRAEELALLGICGELLANGMRNELSARAEASYWALRPAGASDELADACRMLLYCLAWRHWLGQSEGHVSKWRGGVEIELPGTADMVMADLVSVETQMALHGSQPGAVFSPKLLSATWDGLADLILDDRRDPLASAKGARHIIPVSDKGLALRVAGQHYQTRLALSAACCWLERAARIGEWRTRGARLERLSAMRSQLT